MKKPEIIQKVLDKRGIVIYEAKMMVKPSSNKTAGIIWLPKDLIGKMITITYRKGEK